MKKVLIAEDSQTLTKHLQLTLKKYHEKFETVFVGNGLEAINVLQAEKIDMVVTDINMPMMDGLVLLAFMLENCPQIPVIVMSAFGDESLKNVLKQDILLFMDKPVQPDELARMILSALKDTSPEKQVKTFSFVDLMNLIVMGRKTCVFQLKSKSGAQGLFYFNEGDLYNAVCGKIQGDEAFEKIMEWDEADIKFMKAPQSRGEKKIRKEARDLLKMVGQSKLSISKREA